MIYALIPTAAAVYLYIRLRKLEKKAITGTTVNDEVILSLNNKPFNAMKQTNL